MARVNLPLYKLENERLKIVYAGYSTLKRNYLGNLLLGKDLYKNYIGRKPFLGIRSLASSGLYDVIISEISKITCNYFRQSEGIIFPEYAGMRINIDRPISEILDKGVRFPDIIRKIRKYDLSYEILDSKESFNDFYHNFYIPYSTKRHGENARMTDLNTMLKSNSAVLAIKEKGVIVAESLIKKSGDSFYGLQVGIINGNEEYLRHGVLGALYYFCILEGQRTGCRYYDIGSAPAFLKDGLTMYKLSLGAEFIPDGISMHDCLWLGVNEKSHAAREFFLSNPVMCVNDDHKLVKSDTFFQNHLS